MVPGPTALTDNAVMRRRTLLRDASFTAASGFLGYGLSVITGPILAHVLGPTGRGDLAAVLVPAQMFGWLLTFGIPLASVYYAPHYKDRQLVMSAWVFAVVAGGLVVLVSWPLVPHYLSGHDALTVPWLRASLVSMVALLPSYTAINLLMARGRVVAFSALRQFPLVVNTVFVVALAISGRLTLTTALAAALAANLVWFVTALLFTRSWPGAGFRGAVMRLQVRYGSRVALGSAANLLISRLDQFLLVGIVSSRELGLYAVAVTGAGLSGPVGQGVAQVLMPHLRNARHHDDDSANEWTARAAARWTLVASTCVAVIVAASAHWLLPAVLGSGFAGAVTALWILLPGQIANDLGTVVGAKLQADGHPGAVSQGLGVAAVVTVVGLWFAVARFGITGAAVVTTLSQFSFAGFVLASVRRRRGETSRLDIDTKERSSWETV